jgi:homogentisate 1,2-dioxygenase
LVTLGLVGDCGLEVLRAGFAIVQRYFMHPHFRRHGFSLVSLGKEDCHDRMGTTYNEREGKKIGQTLRKGDDNVALIVRRGTLPRTPHTEFYYKPNVLALEEIHGSLGFGGLWTRKMHVRSYPTEQVRAPGTAEFDFVCRTPPEAEKVLQPYLIQTADMPSGGDALRARKALVYGADTRISVVKPERGFADGEFFRNADSYEAYYVQEGEGVLHSEFGDLPFQKEAYLIVPKGTTYRISLQGGAAFFLLIESRYPIEWPPHYINHGGQALLTSPVVETEIEVPELPEAIDERGEFTVFVQHRRGQVARLTLGHHPFDVCGWEGSLYPFRFDIRNHHGIARETHTAPPMHQTFQAGNVPHNGFSLCSFVPQIEGWHPKEVPAPYAHYNVDSDELMFFCNADYGARKGVLRPGSFTFHPGTLPHSPHGAAALRSLASRGQMSGRLAVMLDTYFERMEIAEAGFAYAQAGYAESWNEANFSE